MAQQGQRFHQPPDVEEGPASDAAGRFLFVRLESGLDHSRHEGIFANIRLLPGVELVCDLAVVSSETLDALMLSPDQVIRTRRGRPGGARRTMAGSDKARLAGSGKAGTA